MSAAIVTPVRNTANRVLIKQIANRRTCENTQTKGIMDRLKDKIFQPQKCVLLESHLTLCLLVK
jgi:hypothetical protein